ncbi:MAG: 50S ribosomal protein L18 [bacterium]
MARQKTRAAQRGRRRFRIRRKVSGQPDRPRLAVFRSARHIYVQAIDDLSGKTIASASTGEKELRNKLTSYSGNRAAASLVGQQIAERLAKQGVKTAVFDRGGNRYHGRVKALADSAREHGLKI